MQGTLIGYEGERNFSFDLKRSKTILGREPACDVIVSDAMCSRKHAVIERVGDEFSITDQGSRNGTIVNDERIKERTVLKWGDQIRIGKMNLIFVSRPEPKPKDEPGQHESQVMRRKTVGVNVIGYDLSYVKNPGREHLNLMLEVATRLPELRDADNLKSELLETILRAFKASRAALLTYGEGSEIAGRIVRTSSEMYKAEIELEPELVKLVRATQRGFLQDEDYSAIYAPFRTDDEITGILYVDKFLQSDRLNEDDLWIVYAAGTEFSVLCDGQNYRQKLESEKVRLEEELAAGERIVGDSEAVQRINEQIVEAAPGDAVVVIRGEPGTGRDLVARNIHADGRRRASGFVAVNCAAVQQEELRLELFGQDGEAPRMGAIERANGGTLFLDEISEMPLDLQDAVIAAIQEGAVRRGGSDEPRTVDIRLILASNDNLKGMVSDKRFREALQTGAEIVEIRIPPLRERLEDIKPLSEHFVPVLAGEAGKRIRGVDPGAIDLLKEQEWKGNIREMRNLLERAVIACDGEMLGADAVRSALPGSEEGGPVRLEDIERAHIARVLADSGNNLERAAGILGIDIPTLETKIRAHGITAS